MNKFIAEKRRRERNNVIILGIFAIIWVIGISAGAYIVLHFIIKYW